jgi:hypothetical protein
VGNGQEGYVHLPPEVPDHPHELVLDADVQSGRRLIQYEQVRSLDQRLGDENALFLPPESWEILRFLYGSRPTKWMALSTAFLSSFVRRRPSLLLRMQPRETISSTVAGKIGSNWIAV